MLLLMELTYTDKESQALYNNYVNETNLIADVETKIGQAMKSDSIKAEFLLAFDHTGRIIKQAYHTKFYEDDGLTREYAFTGNRLIWITSTANGEDSNMQNYATDLEAEANYHIKRGSAMKKDDVLAIMTMLVNANRVGNTEYWERTPETEG